MKKLYAAIVIVILGVGLLVILRSNNQTENPVEEKVQLEEFEMGSLPVEGFEKVAPPENIEERTFSELDAFVEHVKFCDEMGSLYEENKSLRKIAISLLKEKALNTKLSKADRESAFFQYGKLMGKAEKSKGLYETRQKNLDRHFKDLNPPTEEILWLQNLLEGSESFCKVSISDYERYRQALEGGFEDETEDCELGLIPELGNEP